MSKRYLGIDIGAEAIKVVEICTVTDRPKSTSHRMEHGSVHLPQQNSSTFFSHARGDQPRSERLIKSHRSSIHLPRSGNGYGIRWTRRVLVEHKKRPEEHLLHTLRDWDWENVQCAAVTGRLSRQVNLTRIPTKQSMTSGFSYFFGEGPATLVSIGSHAFSVLEIRSTEGTVYRENSRCSQGSGNFLRQLIDRFDLSIEDASHLADGVDQSVLLSSRCPVILKTDITHLANRGESRSKILAGLFDAICENVQALVKPTKAPPRVVLIGGVSRIPRIRRTFERYLSRNNLILCEYSEEIALFLEAMGCALIAAQDPYALPNLNDLLRPANKTNFPVLSPLSDYCSQVRRMSTFRPTVADLARRVVLGFDIGSTGSKAVLVDSESCDLLWEGYTNTQGDPVNAAQRLVRQIYDAGPSHHEIYAIGVTGSGREIVGSLAAICFGIQSVFVFNEIAAHATGAHYFDPRVDTIFEIGGQDAKYIRLEDGRVIDAAMNEACSAGTGSFIEEQGRRFQGIENVIQMNQEALLASSGVSLGQHCSVFMAEVIDEAVASGVEQRSIIAGVYDAIIQNYLNRVKCNRKVGQVIFCQGMPFSSDALAAAVVRQTQSRVIVPPNPGTVGAFGIALLTRKEIESQHATVLDLKRFLEAKVEEKTTFICKANQGCGGTGNRCRIDRITTLIGEKRQPFTWGGSCSLYDRGTQRKKLPDRAPDPFRERQELIQSLQEAWQQRNRQAPSIALTDEFGLKDLFPFFASFFTELGYRLIIHTSADQSALKCGHEQANVPFCAPMKLYHGVARQMADTESEYLFLPMLRGIPRVGDAPHSNLCPIVQGSADLLRMDLKGSVYPKIISPVIDIGPGNLTSEAFVRSCKKLALQLGDYRHNFRTAFDRAVEQQKVFEARSLEFGRKALQFCSKNGLIAVVVLGRPYTIYNKVLNSNVPAILREQGVVTIPIDCYPVSRSTVIFKDMYWGHGQRNLRAAQQIRSSKDVYSVWCSNYSCGPDGFLLHFYSYIMNGKPYAIVETDGHSGDAGTKTRIEAFLYCVKEDRKGSTRQLSPTALQTIEMDSQSLLKVKKYQQTLLIPAMGCASPAISACLCGLGFLAECLPEPDQRCLFIGRKQTSGKECLPITITVGSLLSRLEQEPNKEKQFAFLMPTSNGPCRFGVYGLFHKLTLERLNFRDRVHVIAPHDSNYFEGVPAGFSVLIYIAFVASELLHQAFLDLLAQTHQNGSAERVYLIYRDQLHHELENAGRHDLSLSNALRQVVGGELFGIRNVMECASSELAPFQSSCKPPTVLLTGEIYNRLVPFANDYLIEKLSERGIRVHLSPILEWLEYSDYMSNRHDKHAGLGDYISSFVRKRIFDQIYSVVAKNMEWEPHIPITDIITASSPYLREQLEAESILTIGSPLSRYRRSSDGFDGVISVGPLECMPNKIAESLFFHITDHTGIPFLNLALNGDPIDIEVLDAFVYEVYSRYNSNKHDHRTKNIIRGNSHISRKEPTPACHSREGWINMDSHTTK